ncbi:MAG: DeoR/GlpR transcriptional regulator [Lutibacter sp.]|uniref:DeoR/GlpR family DNA-binding transcription regulator n=1 Tax=Lutibacter sp. TaxID=1925666 RepID=UPI0017C2237A|nr:DeoR/GlpR family DNA-binding transcription regulator [Lutibacter sp.]MBT8317958.1 DeoR/GlpR family DNA-binding transcription regulator [Lutibacter sp.]NNJ58816.1 DeoR/GlpR transcriptional regulator [Lutibacter sp.]
MLKEERHHQILDKIKLNRKVLSSDLSIELQVSEDTIRRDLNELSAKGFIKKVHGGALPIDAKAPSYEERKFSSLKEKNSIAKKAVSLIKDGQVIIMSGSTTNLQLAKIIPSDINATIYTYSLPIALQLTEHPSIEIIFIGGKLNKPAQVTVGLDVVSSISQLRADLCFMGTGGINVTNGMTEPNWEVSHIKKCMIEASEKVIVLCTSNKINEVKRYSVTPINRIDTIVTDLNSKNEIFYSFKEKGVTIL